MRRTWVGRAECRGTAVHYYLVTEETAGLERYGLQVCYGEEAETVGDITASRREIQSLLDAMVRGGVTPVAARDVVEDWLNRTEA